MSIPTQGTELFAIDPADDSLINVGCVQSISGLIVTNEEIETTCLANAVRTYVGGLGTPGDVTLEVNFDPADATHVRLLALHQSKDTIKWAIGFSEEAADPTVDSVGDYVLQSTRSYLEFDGFIMTFGWDFGQNDVVKAPISIKQSGSPVLTPAA